MNQNYSLRCSHNLSLSRKQSLSNICFFVFLIHMYYATSRLRKLDDSKVEDLFKQLCRSVSYCPKGCEPSFEIVSHCPWSESRFVHFLHPLHARVFLQSWEQRTQPLPSAQDLLPVSRQTRTKEEQCTARAQQKGKKHKSLNVRGLFLENLVFANRPINL